MNTTRIAIGISVTVGLAIAVFGILRFQREFPVRYLNSQSYVQLLDDIEGNHLPEEGSASPDLSNGQLTLTFQCKDADRLRALTTIIEAKHLDSRIKFELSISGAGSRVTLQGQNKTWHTNLDPL